jgi:hypothetical protein
MDYLAMVVLAQKNMKTDTRSILLNIMLTGARVPILVTVNVKKSG